MQIDKENLVRLANEYASGSMSNADAEQFEEYFLSRPDVLDLVERAQTTMIESNKRDHQAEQDGGMTWFGELISNLSQPTLTPIFSASLVFVALIGQGLLLSGFGSRADEIRLAGFTTAKTRTASMEQPSRYVAKTDLRSVANEAVAVMVKFTQEVEQEYKLQVFDSMNLERPVWESDLFVARSGNRDQIVSIPTVARIDNASIKVLGRSEGAPFKYVQFCHYSEACL